MPGTSPGKEERGWATRLRTRANPLLRPVADPLATSLDCRMIAVQGSSDGVSSTASFVGSRLDFFAFAFGLPLSSVTVSSLKSGAGAAQVMALVALVAASLVCALVRAARPNRLQLDDQGIVLTRPWSKCLKLTWADVDPPFLVTFTGKGGRKRNVARFTYTVASTGKKRVVTLPSDLGVSALSLLMEVNEARSAKRDGVHGVTAHHSQHASQTSAPGPGWRLTPPRTPARTPYPRV
jgi:hypothetical protein